MDQFAKYRVANISNFTVYDKYDKDDADIVLFSHIFARKKYYILLQLRHHLLSLCLQCILVNSKLNKDKASNAVIRSLITILTTVI